MAKENNIERWLNGEMSPEENLAFENSEDFKKIKRLDKALMAFRAPAYNAEYELEKVNERKSLERPKMSLWKRPMVRIAATVVILLGVFLIFRLNNDRADFHEFANSQEQFYLPDSSEVILNKDSRIRFSATNQFAERELELEGEAFFKVKKGSTFKVQTNLGRIEVLGTAFNVVSRSDFFEVNCFHGKVKVTSGDQDQTIIAGQSVRLDGNELNRVNIKLDNVPSWTRGESAFESVSVKYVFNEFERQYGKAIVSEDQLVDQLFSGRFTHDDINLALKSITIPLGLEYHIKGDLVYIDRATAD